jgi:hypothetical protein
MWDLSQGPLQLTSQLSGGAQEPSLDDTGGEDVKWDSTSWKGRQQEDEGKETTNGANKQSSVSKEDNKAGKSRDKTPGGEIFADHNSPVLELQISCGTSDIDMGVKDVAWFFWCQFGSVHGSLLSIWGQLLYIEQSSQLHLKWV